MDPCTPQPLASAGRSPEPAATAAAGMALVALAAVGFGLNPVFARLAYAAGLSPVAATLYRFAIPALLLLPALPRAFATPRLAAIAMGAGVLVGAGTLAFFQALEVLPVASASLVYYAYPAFALLWARLVFRQRLRRRHWVAVGLAGVGSALTLGPTAPGAHQWQALLLCTLAPVAYGLLLNLLATTLAPLPVLPKTSAAVLGCVLGVAPLALLSDTPLAPTGAAALWAIAALSGGGMLLPALLLTLGAPRAGTAPTAIIGSFELAIALVAAWLLLGEAMTALQAAGAALVLGAALLAAAPRAKVSAAAVR